MADAEVALSIKTQHGSVYSVKAGKTDTVARLKALIEAASGEPVVYQRLFYLGRVLVDHRSLEHYAISSGAELHLRTGSGKDNASSSAVRAKYTAFWKACERGDIATLRSCLPVDNIDEPQTLWGDHYNGLMFASLYGRTEAVQVLLEQRAKVDARTKTGRTALALAAQHGWEATATLLLENGASPTALDDQGRSPVDVAKPAVKDIILGYARGAPATTSCAAPSGAAPSGAPANPPAAASEASEADSLTEFHDADPAPLPSLSSRLTARTAGGARSISAPPGAQPPPRAAGRPPMPPRPGMVRRVPDANVQRTLIAPSASGILRLGLVSGTCMVGAIGARYLADAAHTAAQSLLGETFLGLVVTLGICALLGISVCALTARAGLDMVPRGTAAAFGTGLGVVLAWLVALRGVISIPATFAVGVVVSSAMRQLNTAIGHEEVFSAYVRGCASAAATCWATTGALYPLSSEIDPGRLFQLLPWVVLPLAAADVYAAVVLDRQWGENSLAALVDVGRLCVSLVSGARMEFASLPALQDMFASPPGIAAYLHLHADGPQAPPIPPRRFSMGDVLGGGGGSNGVPRITAAE